MSVTASARDAPPFETRTLGKFEAQLVAGKTMAVTDLDAVLTGPPIGSTDEFVERLAAIQKSLPATDGLAYFNHMYGLVTRSVVQNLGITTFADPVWMSHLDIVFGNLYLNAVRDSMLTPSAIPPAWAPLLERRSDAGIAPLQFALAGMNAHINRDLPVAVVTTCTDLNTTPDDGSHHADFFAVNAVLAEVEPRIRQETEGTLLEDADTIFPGLQDVVANFNMVKARETAWANAGALWVCSRVAPDHGAAYIDALDHLTGFAGRGLLVRLKQPGAGARESGG
jgi:uncharacterized protein DUF5995